MKYAVYLLALLACLNVDLLQAQTTSRRAASEARRRSAVTAEEEPKATGLSVRAQNKFGAKKETSESAEPWMREIYRELSEEKEENMPLFFPKNPTEKSMNLFTLIFKLLANGSIKAYEYDVDRGELFDEQYQLSFVDLLERYKILYEEEVERGTKKINYKVDNSDIPSQSVKSYYVKEIYTFDKISSTYKSAVYCLAPIIYQSDNYGTASQRIPMFWIKYDELVPYLNQMSIMASSVNNTMRLTYNDYFVMKKYKGDIYKSTNLANKSLMQIAKNDTTLLRMEREKIEKQLGMFEETLWVKQDTTAQAQTKQSDKKQKTARAEVASGKAKSSGSTVKNKNSREKSSSGGTRTVRASVRR